MSKTQMLCLSLGQQTLKTGESNFLPSDKHIGYYFYFPSLLDLVKLWNNSIPHIEGCSSSYVHHIVRSTRLMIETMNAV